MGRWFRSSPSHLNHSRQFASIASSPHHYPSPLHNGSEGGGGGQHNKWLLTATVILAWDTCTYIFGETFWDQIGYEENWLDDG